MITVKYYGMLIKKAGTESEDFECKKVSDVLKKLREKYGKEFYKNAKMSYILVNDINSVKLDGYKTKLSDNDVVKFLPVCGGG